MMDDFQFIYGNDDKITKGTNMAKIVFDSSCLGYWDADTNTPSLSDGIGTDKKYYIINVAGSQDLGSGIIAFEIDDYIKYNVDSLSWVKTK